MGDLGSANRYTYANDDPVNAVDPSGKYSTTDLVIACVVGAVGGIATLYLAALIPVILLTGPAGAITLGAALLAILFGCILAELSSA